MIICPAGQIASSLRTLIQCIRLKWTFNLRKHEFYLIKTQDKMKENA